MNAVAARSGSTNPTPLALLQEADARPAVARVAESTGTVTLVRGKDGRETLREGDFLYQGDAVETTGDGAVKLLFADGTQFALANNAVFVIDRYEYDFATQEGLAAFSILKGMFLFGAGEIAAQDPRDMTISTPVATIALRDGEPSRFVGDVSPAGEVSRFTLLAGDVILFTKAGAITLDLVNETAVIQNLSVIPAPPILLELDEVIRLYGPIGKIAGDFFGAPDEDQNLAEIAELLAEIAPAAGPAEEGATDDAAPELDSPFRLDSTPFRDDGPAAPEGGDTDGIGAGSGGGSESDGDGGSGAGGIIESVAEDDDPPVLPEPEPVEVPTTIVGGTGSDVIIGTDGGDTILGGQGNDNIQGGDGDDVFLVDGAGNGFDQVFGGDGNDQIAGGDGDDVLGFTGFSDGNSVETIDGGDGFDVIQGTGSNNVLDFSGTTLTGIETIDGGGGNDVIIGSAGDDTIVGGSGIDNLSGGSGDDVFVVQGTNNGFNRFSGGEGTDLVVASDNDDVIGLSSFSGTNTVETIDGGDGFDVIQGTGSNNVLDFSGTTLTGIETIDGGGGNDVIIGSAGDDTIVGGSGIDNLSGGSGDDVFVVQGTNNGFNRFSGGEGNDLVVASDNDDVIGLSSFSGTNTVETIDGGDGFDVIQGTGSNNVLDFSGTTLTGIETIDGGGGNDVIIGSAGDDTIVGGSGIDNLSGGSGDDVFVVQGTNNGFNRFSGGEGNDLVVASDNDDVIGLSSFSGTNTVETIDGGDGFDVIQGTGSNNVLDFSGTTLTGIETIDGGGGNDVIIGSAGDDTIVGGSGIDNLSGGSGDDVFVVQGTNNGFNRFSGGEGTDLVVASDNDDVIGLSSFSGTNTVETIDGGDGVDVIQGTGSNNVLDFSGTTLTGIETIDGGGGNDVIIGSVGDDTIVGGPGNDRLEGGLGNDALLAGPGADRLIGNEGDDRLFIENDDFFLLDGGAGTDTVVFDFTLDLQTVIDTRLQNIESFDLRSGGDAELTIGLNDVLAAASGINALTNTAETLLIRRDAGDAVNVVGDNWTESVDTLDTDDDGVGEGYTVFHDSAAGATVYVENV